MDYADEDEVDWSDGTLTSPSPKLIEITTDPGHLDPYADVEKNYQSLFVADSYGEHNIPCGLPLGPGKQQILTLRYATNTAQPLRELVALVLALHEFSEPVLAFASTGAFLPKKIIRTLFSTKLARRHTKLPP